MSLEGNYVAGHGEPEQGSFKYPFALNAQPIYQANVARQAGSQLSCQTLGITGKLMASSPFFIRIKSDVLKIVLCIPKGKVCSYACIGEHLDVVPRHVAYILSTLEPLEKIQYPWHRVVGGDGNLGKLKRSENGATQSELLQAEGVLVVGNCVEPFPGALLVPVIKLKSGIKKQTRPVDAPPAMKKKIRVGNPPLQR